MLAHTDTIWTPVLRQTGFAARCRGRAPMGFVFLVRDAISRGAVARRPLPKEGVT